MSFNLQDLFGVRGKVVVITGGGTGVLIDSIILISSANPVNSGIGLMMATALENNGATVYILGRRLEVLENAARRYAVRFDDTSNFTSSFIITYRRNMTK